MWVFFNIKCVLCVCVCVCVNVHACACVCVQHNTLSLPISVCRHKRPRPILPARLHKESIKLINLSFCWLLFFVCFSCKGQTKRQPVHLTDFGSGIYWTRLVKYWKLPDNTNPESTQSCLWNIPEVGLICKATKELLGRSHFDSSSHSCFTVSGLYCHCLQPPLITRQHICMLSPPTSQHFPADTYPWRAAVHTPTTVAGLVCPGRGEVCVAQGTACAETRSRSC